MGFVFSKWRRYGYEVGSTLFALEPRPNLHRRRIHSADLCFWRYSLRLDMPFRKLANGNVFAKFAMSFSFNCDATDLEGERFEAV